MLHDILPTKLNVPPIRQYIVSRPRLLDKLNRGLDAQGHTFSGRLSLLSAPAGYGKSTLTVDWVTRLEQSLGIKVCWLSLDDQDNSPARFFTYLTAALQTVNPAWGQMVSGMLQAPEPPPPTAFMGSLIRDLSSASPPQPIVFVLDDFHLITTRTIHDAIAFLLDHQPAHFHLVIITREDPMLPLARLRVRRQMTEIRLADLRFTVEETAAFLRDVKGLQLDQPDVIALGSRTEGWIAGLQLAALSMQQSEDASAFIRSFTGSSRYLLDYLIEEVIAQQTADIQTFLLHTSCLTRFNAPLCDAVTGRADSAQVLPELLHANLFLIPLDENQQWFRYHHLFAELLQHRLQLVNSDTASLHLRAAEWFQDQGFFDEAIPHFLAAKAWPQAADALLVASERMLRRGEARTLLHWFAQLPSDLVSQRPPLAMQYVWALIVTGQLDAAEPYLDKLAEQAQQIPEFLAQVLLAQAYLARTRYDVPRTIALSQRALALLPAEQVSNRAVLAVNLGIAHWNAGQVADAERVLTEARFTADQARNHYARDMAVGFLAVVQGTQGKLAQAADMLQQALAIGADSPTSGLAHRVLAALLYEWNDLDEAVTHLAQAETWVQAIGSMELLGGVLRGWAVLKQAQGDTVGVAQVLARMHALAEKHQMPPFVCACNAAVHVQIALAQNDIATAVHWASKVTEPADGSPFFPRLHLTPARLLLAQDQNEAALQQLDALYKQAREANWVWGVVEIRLLQVLAAADTDGAQAFLHEALTLAQPAGLVRTFVDKGAPILTLLQQISQQNVLAAYVSQLLSHFSTFVVEPAPSGPAPTGAAGLIEPLSERELEIVQLLARRQTNAEIAQTLMVSVNTVKTHLQHIYEKLGVNDRKAAVTRAHNLHLLPTEGISFTR